MVTKQAPKQICVESQEFPELSYSAIVEPKPAAKKKERKNKKAGKVELVAGGSASGSSSDRATQALLDEAKNSHKANNQSSGDE